MSVEDRVAREVVVRGLVQGVFFRDSCRRVALAARVSGWVRNELDGSVVALLEGPDAGVDRVLAWMHKGPRGAVVDEIDVVEREPVGLTAFFVR